MFDFVVPITIVWILTAGVYRLFELCIRRKERMILIEKIGAELQPSILNGGFDFLNVSFKSFSGLKIGCLLIGIGLGLVAGLIIVVHLGCQDYNNKWDMFTVAYLAPVLIFGGLGLLIAFLIENKVTKKVRSSE
ncbi:MAG: hypothetical protein LBT48_05800 [Prevotellaceae bacterium]|jgi:hypothetical protein|nr:hypothetical protein [Prevotellaceae bacterium]